MTGNLFSLPNPSCRPITFTSDSIGKIEQDLKTQTRRVIYPLPTGDALIQNPKILLNWHPKDDLAQVWKCPYGVPGGRLWVRQVWARVEPFPGVMEDFRMPLAWRVEKNPVLLRYWRQRVIFLSDFPGKIPEECDRGASDNVWRSPTTLPRWASRRQLEVTAIRTERLQAISAEDAKAEGAKPIMPPILYPDEPISEYDYRRGFQRVWNAINEKKNPWESNPLVWSISFRKVDACAI
jgi:hypothetical protein